MLPVCPQDAASVPYELVEPTNDVDREYYRDLAYEVPGCAVGS